MTTERPRFHLAFPVDDLAAARRFYGDVLGCPEGRSADHWVDFDLYGHQIVAHLVARPADGGADRTTTPVDGDAVPAPRPADGGADRTTTPVDGDAVPVPHFGVLLRPDDWRRLADRLQAAGVDFVVEPHVRFEGRPGEQSTMFVLDPAGNALEFKAFADDAAIFADDAALRSADVG